MKVLVVGSGGREHAICTSVAKSPRVDKIYCAPGNAGIAALAECVPIGAMEFDKLVAFAKENKIAVGFGYVKDLGSKCENHYAVVNSNGEVISDYAKIHPFSAGYESEYFVGGSEITKYKINGMNFSTFICYDLRFPEIFQAVREDSDIIVVPANWPRSRSEHFKTLLKARAIETECYVLGINCVGVHDDTYYSGDTMAINPFGEVIKCVSNIQDLLVVNINNDVAEYREKLNTNKDRRPDLYKKFLY